MHIFYAPDIKTNPCLSEEESLHAVKVLRLGEGADITVFDGKGGVYEATIAQAHPKHCLLNAITEKREVQARPYKLHIAIAPTKNNDRLEWFAEKAAEIGIDEISPVICDFSERRILKTDRLRKILVSAMKQSMQPQLVKLNEPQSFADFLSNIDGNCLKLMAHCHDGEKTPLAHAVKASNDILIMIGPEGDFSEEEVAAATKAGFLPVTLGTARLRVETAALVACTTVNVIRSF